MQFEIPIIEERGKKSYIITLHLLVCFLLIVTGIFEVLLHLFFAKTAGAKFPHFTLLKIGGVLTFILGLALLSIIIFKNKWLIKPTVNKTLRITEFIIFISFALVAWNYDVQYPALIFGITAAALLYGLYWENQAIDKKVIIGEKGISLPKAGRNFLHWQEVQRVLLRHGIITIDCLDNHLFQWNIQSFSFDEEIFSEFCKAQIAAGVKDRKKDW